MTKKYISAINVLVIGFLFFIAACQPVYIPDPIDPRLPKYTEEGYDVAGALINDSIWKSQRSVFSVNKPKIVYYRQQDSLSITMYGEVKDNIRYDFLSFSLKGLGLSSAEEFAKLNNQKITLDGITTFAQFDEFENNTCKGIGQLYLRAVTSANSSVTLSGTFGFNWDDPVCGKVIVSYGRFDFGLTPFEVI